MTWDSSLVIVQPYPSSMPRKIKESYDLQSTQSTHAVYINHIEYIAYITYIRAW